MMKYWLPMKGCPDDTQFKEMMHQSGSTFIALNENERGHSVPTLIQDVVKKLVNCDPEDIGILTMFTLCTNPSHAEQMMELLNRMYQPIVNHIGEKNIRSHIIYIDGDTEPQDLDSSLWQRLVPWWQAYDKDTRNTMVFNNVIYGDETPKISSKFITENDPHVTENIDVTSMGRTMQKLTTFTQTMNGNTIILYSQEPTNDEIGNTCICVV